MTDIRRCKQCDIQALVVMMEIATRAQLPGMRPDGKKTSALVRRNMTDPSSLVLVSDTGFLIAIEQSFAWFEKKYTQILMLDADAPDVCTDLLNECISWWDTRRASLVLTYSSPKTTVADQVLLEADFENNGTMLIRRKYNGL